MPVARANEFRPGNTTLSFVNDYMSAYDFSAGPTVQTGNPLDVAINGDGWLTVQTPEGERYTRNGSLGISQTGELVTQAGHPVLGTGGPITFTKDDKDIVIASDGTITTSEGTRGQLRLVSFADQDTLTPAGDTLFEGANPQPNDGARVVQGMIERSNVQGVVEMTRLIAVSRSYQSVSKMIEKTDELHRKAISELGRIEA